MIEEIGSPYLINTTDWFLAPDGERYKAVFGTVHAVKSAEDTLGIKTNRGSTNWYVHIGNMIVAGCQIHYCIRTDSVSRGGPIRMMEHDGRLIEKREDLSHIYMAD